MGRYAAGTDVPTSRSRDEIERTLARYGATRFGYMTSPGAVQLGFEAHGKLVRFDLPMPHKDADEFTLTAQHRLRSDTAATAAWEQACRQSWRALALVIKAKLEAVEAGITTFEDEFLAHMVLPDGRTFGQWARPELDRVYADGGRSMPALLPGSNR